MKLNKIYNCDCFELFNQLEDNSVDYVFTSPPYNRKRNDKYSDYNDTISDYYGFLSGVIEQARRVARKHVFLNVQITYYNASDIYRLIGAYADCIRQTIVWEKTNPMPASGKSITNAYEIILVIGDESLKSNETYTKNIIHTPVNGKMPKNHKAVMHYDVADWFIKKFTQPNELIFDPFMGIGTTALACLRNGRFYVGSEISKEYCDMAYERLRDSKKEDNGREIEQ